METSHLVNVIGHHLTQIETLNTLNSMHPRSILRERTNMLWRVIHVLTEELVQRSVDDGEYLL